MIFNSLRKYSAAFYLVMFFSSSALAAANGTALQSDSIFPIRHSPVEMVYSHSALTLEPFDHSNVETVLGIRRKSPDGYHIITKRLIPDLEGGDILFDSLNDGFKTPAISLYKDGDKTIWSLTPSLNKFTFNPVEDIKHLEVLLQYRIWF